MAGAFSRLLLGGMVVIACGAVFFFRAYLPDGWPRPAATAIGWGLLVAASWLLATGVAAFRKDRT